MQSEPPSLPLDLYAFGRGLAYSGALLLVGACVFLTLIPRWRAATDDDGSLAARALSSAIRVATVAGIVLLLAHAIRAYGQVRSFLEPMEPLSWASARPMLVDSAWGRGWLAQVGAALAAFIAARLAARRPAPGLALLSTAALLVAGSSPLTGHAGEHPWGAPFGIGLHALHLLGGGIWLGTLAAIACAALPTVRVGAGSDHAALARLIAAFSPLALIGAGLAVGAGAVLGWTYIGDLRTLTSTTYGRTLIAKVVVLALTMAIGGWNWRRVAPALGSEPGTRRLRRSVSVELGLALLLVGLTALLVALPAPRI